MQLGSLLLTPIVKGRLIVGTRTTKSRIAVSVAVQVRVAARRDFMRNDRLRMLRLRVWVRVVRLGMVLGEVLNPRARANIVLLDRIVACNYI